MIRVYLPVHYRLDCEATLPKVLPFIPLNELQEILMVPELYEGHMVYTYGRAHCSPLNGSTILEYFKNPIGVEIDTIDYATFTSVVCIGGKVTMEYTEYNPWRGFGRSSLMQQAMLDACKKKRLKKARDKFLKGLRKR